MSTEHPSTLVDDLLEMLNKMVETDTVGITCLFRPAFDVSVNMNDVENAVVYVRSADTPGETYVTALSLVQSVLLLHGDDRVIIPNFHTPTGLIESFSLLRSEPAPQLELID